MPTRAHLRRRRSSLSLVSGGGTLASIKRPISEARTRQPIVQLSGRQRRMGHGFGHARRMVFVACSRSAIFSAVKQSLV
jgi:hypothetical protein